MEQTENERLLLSVSFTAKFKLVFVLTQESTFSQKCIINPTERAQVFLKNGARDLQNSHPFERSTCFYVTITENFERFQNEFFSERLQQHFLVESTKTENTMFPHKATLSETNDETIKMESIKQTYHKKRSFGSNYFIFLKVLSQFKKLL